MGLTERKKREIRALAKASAEALVDLAEWNLRKSSKVSAGLVSRGKKPANSAKKQLT